MIPYKVKDVNVVKRHVEKHHPILIEQDGSGKKRRRTSTIQNCFGSVQKRDLKPSLAANQRMGEALLFSSGLLNRYGHLPLLKTKAFYNSLIG